MIKSRKTRRKEAIQQALELVRKYGIDAHQPIVEMVKNDFSDLLEGMDEDEAFDYASGICNFAEHQYGGMFRT